MTARNARRGLAVALTVVLIAGVIGALRISGTANRVHVTGYFANSNGLYVGDEVRVLGVPVGKIDTIEPQVDRVKITFWYDSEVKVPAEAKAVIVSPYLVSVRAIQLAPAYTDGPVMSDNAVIPRERTAVPVEWDEFREQLEKLADSLQPTDPNGVSTLGSFVNTAADNLRGEGANIRDTLIKVSQAFSALEDRSSDLFGTVENVSILVSALSGTADLMRQLNQNLGIVTGLLADEPNEVGNAVADINAVVGDVRAFVSDNKEDLATTSEKLASVTTVLNESLDDVEQVLHAAPTPLANLVNIYQPAQGTLTGVLAVNNFANPVTFLCGAIQAASRLNAEQSAKLCVQYLAPIVKNRQLMFPPLGVNPFVGATARPNELTYSEDWLRPDYVPPPSPRANAASTGEPSPMASPIPVDPVLAAEAATTDPSLGLEGLMTPHGVGP